jgi:hypothetical protein
MPVKPQPLQDPNTGDGVGLGFPHFVEEDHCGDFCGDPTSIRVSLSSTSVGAPSPETTGGQWFDGYRTLPSEA